MDFLTLAVAMYISNVLQVAALAVQSRIARKESSKWWTLGIASNALGFFAMFLRSIPALTLVGVFANNVFFVLGHTLLYIGVLRFFERYDLRKELGLFLGAFILADFYFVFIFNHLIWRGSILYLTIAFLSFLTAWTLWKYKLRALTGTVNFLAITFALHGVVFFAGFVIGLVIPPATNSPTGANPAQLLGLLDGLIVSTLWTFGFILMVNQRLNLETREARAEMELIFNASPDAALVTRLSDGMVVDMNEGFSIVSGFSRSEVIANSTRNLNLWQDPLYEQAVMVELRQNGVCANQEYEFLRKNGSPFTGLFSARLVTLRGEAHVLSVIHDVSERKQLERKLHEQATTDELTGVANRRRFMELADYELKRSQRLNHPLTLVVIDIDFFKQINDTYGHQAGDKALLNFARLGRQHIREIDILARIGGDEFAILLPSATAAQASEAIERLHAALASSNEEPHISISAGIASSQGESETLESLLRRADQALYRAKNAGRGRSFLSAAEGSLAANL